MIVIPTNNRTPRAGIPSDSLTPTNKLLRMAAARPSAGGFVLWLHGSGGSGEESRAQVEPYFSAPGLASSVRLSFPTAPTATIPCYGERHQHQATYPEVVDSSICLLSFR